jgi:phospholipid/cholesterol/gamma-HCH transport system permease protein
VVLLHGIPGNVLLDVHWSVQTLADYFFTLITITAIAVPTALIACFYGLRTTGGPAAVGGSVARSVLVNIVLLHLIAAFFAVLVYGTDLRLPIGG